MQHTFTHESNISDFSKDFCYFMITYLYDTDLFSQNEALENLLCEKRLACRGE